MNKHRNKKMQYQSVRVLLLLSLFLVCENMLFSQNSSVTGIALTDNSEPLEYFDAILRNAKDSSISQTGAFFDGKFEFQNLDTGEYVIQISSAGYLPKFVNCRIKEAGNMDLGQVKLNALVLEEVKISAKRPMITRKEGNLVVDVKNSSLSDAGTSIDVLRKSPGVVVDNRDNISIIGKGSPIIYINGKEVNSKSELDILQSNDIESVEINRNPSAEYSASAHAIIKITTKKITTDKLNVLVSNDSYIGRKFRNVAGIKINSKVKKMSNYLSYSNNFSDNNQFIEAYENNYLDNGTIYNRNNGENTYHRNTHNIFYGTSFNFNHSNILGFQLLSSLVDGNDSSFTRENIENGNISQNREIINNGDNSDRFYDLNLNYYLKIDSLTNLYVIADYANKKLTGINDINEQSNSNRISFTRINNKSLYDVFSAQMDLDKILFNKWETKLGLKYSAIDNTCENNIENPNSTVDLVVNSTISDQISAAYLSVKRQSEKYEFNAGIRFEYTQSKTLVNDIENDKISKEYSNFFPSALFVYNPSENFNISLSYSERISRPGFNEINPKITYFDSLSYGVGNPYIKPTLSHNIEIGMNLFKNFSLEFDYRKEIDKRIQVATNDETNPHITKYVYKNIDVAHFFSSSISYNLARKVFSNYSSLGMDIPYIELPYFNSKRTVKKPVFYFQTNNEFIIHKSVTFYVSFKYESSGETDITYWEENYSLSSGIYTRLFKKKLFVSLAVDDIFKTATNSWCDKYLNIESGQITDNDTRRLKLSLKYSFNRFNNIFDKKSSNEQDLDRL